MGFNVGPTCGVAAAAEMSSETYSAKSYMAQVLATLAGANGATSPSVILNAYQFLSAMESGQNFNVTMGPNGQSVAKGQSFDFSFLTPDQKTQLKNESDALFSTFAETVQDPNSDNAYGLPLVDNTTGQPATLLSLIQNPNDTYTVTASCNGSIDSPDWAPDLNYYYGNGTLIGGSGDDFTEDNGNISVSGDIHSVYCGGGETFSAQATGSEWEKYAQIQPTAGTGPGSTYTTEQTLAAFLDQNM